MTTPTAAPARAKPILRTTESTTNRVRALAATMSGRLAGRRVTQDDLIAALCDLADDLAAERDDRLFRFVERRLGAE